MNLSQPSKFAALPACVLLDLDNTLYPYAPSHTAGMTAVRNLAKELLGLAEPDFDRCFDEARAELKARLGAQASSHNRLLYFQMTLERAGLSTRPLEALQLEQAYWLAYLDKMHLFPNVLNFLDDLRLLGVPAVIVTDLTAAIQMRKMVALGLDSSIEWVVTSEESGRDKPDAASFELALAKLGGVDGAIWMIGDDRERDLGGAKQSVGATTLLFMAEKGAKTDGDDIDGSFSDYGDLRDLLDKAKAP
ncbi:MAG: HAD family hydrolase [Pseudomonadota bacterium]